MKLWLLLFVFSSLSCSIKGPYDRLELSQSPNNPNEVGNTLDNPNEVGNTLGNPVVGVFPNSQTPAARSNALPYELIPDTLTALTCSNSVSFGQGGYTLSLGSYVNGLRFTDSFKETYNIREGSDQARTRQLINQSPLRGAVAELSLRDESNLNSIVTLGNNPIREYYPRLDSVDNVNQLINDGRALFVRPTSGRVSNSGNFRANLRVNAATFLNFVPSLAQGNLGRYLLTLVYTVPSGNSNPLPIHGNPSNGRSELRPYGKTYKIEFNDSFKADYLTEVYEEDLLNAENGPGWECPSDLKVMVNANQGVNNRFNELLSQYNIPPEGYCDVGQEPRSGSKRQQFNKLKRFLQLEFGSEERNWPFKLGITALFEGNEWVTNNDPCLVIPVSQGRCYAPASRNNFYRVEYDLDKLSDCARIKDIFNRDVQDVNSQLYKVCPAFLSMCYRVEENN